MKLRGLAVGILLLVAGAALADDLQRARAAAQALSTQLKSTLTAVITSEGPLEAVNTCHHEAATITKKAAPADLIVARTALRIRNPANSPSAWQRNVMLDWLRSLVDGHALDELEFFEPRSNGGFRYMKPIIMEATCLVCHGRALDPELERAILDAYPQDMARGFELGEFRGAVVVETKFRAAP